MGRHLPIVLIAALIPGAATATEVIPGPINARVVSVYDGDTMVVDTEPWPGLTVHTKVRLAEVDTPELRGECQAEKDMAIRARDFVRATAGAGKAGAHDLRLGHLPLRQRANQAAQRSSRH